LFQTNKENTNGNRVKICQNSFWGTISFIFSLFCAEKIFFKIELKKDIFDSKGDFIWAGMFVISIFLWGYLKRNSMRNGKYLIDENDYLIRSSTQDNG